MGPAPLGGVVGANQIQERASREPVRPGAQQIRGHRFAYAMMPEPRRSMAIRIGFGGSAAKGGGGRPPLRYVGLALAAVGLLLAVAGGLFVGWGLAGGIAAARHELWIGAAVCALLVYAGLLLLGVLPAPVWVQKAVAVARRYGPGLLFVGAGLAVIGVGLAGGASVGVPAFVVVAAGLTFLLAGLVAVQYRGQDTVLTRFLVALLVTALTAASTVFLPSFLFMAWFTVLAWIAVARLVVQTRTGRDPLAGWSDERQLGLGCGITVIIAALIIGVLQLRSCARPPETRPPAEAVGSTDR